MRINEPCLACIPDSPPNLGQLEACYREARERLDRERGLYDTVESKRLVVSSPVGPVIHYHELEEFSLYGKKKFWIISDELRFRRYNML